MGDRPITADMGLDAEQAVARLCAMATFRDGETSRRQIGAQLDTAQADFARCLTNKKKARGPTRDRPSDVPTTPCAAIPPAVC